MSLALKDKLSKEQRREAVLSLQQYFEQNLPEPIGDLAAGLLLDYVLQEIGPLLYNLGVADAQSRALHHLAELDGELHESPFTYWSKVTGKRSR